MGPLQKKVESMEAPQNRRFYENMECLYLWPNYIGEKWRSLGKTYGIKARCYCEHIRNLGNILGTHWELEREHVGNKGKRKKKSSAPHPKPKRKKIKAL